MTFDEVLAQIITLLKRQGRVRILPSRYGFALDDEYLEALQGGIALYVHPVRG